MGRAATGRQLVVWMHVVTSVGWMSQAVALLALLMASTAADPDVTREFAAAAAEYLDAHVLVFFANASAFTGLLLAAATPWGYVRFWWVAVKLVLTIAQIYAGIAVLSPALHATADAAAAGLGPVVAVPLGAGLMASALAFQTWLSVAKPWGRTPLPRSGERGWVGPPALFAAAVVATLVDVVVGSLLFPLPAMSLAVLAVALVLRTRAGSGKAQRASSSSRP